MADKTVITPQQRFKVLTKLFEAGFKSEKDLQSINFQNVFRIEGLTVQDMSKTGRRQCDAVLSSRTL